MTAGFDASRPNMARVYDYWLGGKEHFAADRQEAGRLLEIYPQLRDLVQENRAFITHAVSWAARQGTCQFIDLGAGLPASPRGPPDRAGSPARGAGRLRRQRPGSAGPRASPPGHR